LIKIQRTCK